jgi:hypothetical protein
MRIFSRREIVLGGVATAVALPFSPMAAERHNNPLKIPKLIDGVTGARRTFELDVAARNFQFSARSSNSNARNQ